MPFECMMCMEFLESEAPPDSVAIPSEEDFETALPGPSQRSPKKNKKAKPEVLKNVSVIPCGHMFHRACLNRWFSTIKGRVKNCPSCRERVTVNRVLLLKPISATQEEEPDNAQTPPGCGIDECQCPNYKCNNLYATHGILINEYETIQESMPDKDEEMAILSGKLASLKEERKQLLEESGSSASVGPSVKTKKILQIDLTEESPTEPSASSSTVVSYTTPCSRSTTAQLGTSRSASKHPSPSSTASGSAPGSSSSYYAQSSVSYSPDLLLEEAVASKRSKRELPRRIIAKNK